MSVVGKRDDAGGVLLVRVAGPVAIVMQGRPGYAPGDVADDVIALGDAAACEWLASCLVDAAEMIRAREGRSALPVAGAPVLLPTGSGS